MMKIRNNYKKETKIVFIVSLVILSIIAITLLMIYLLKPHHYTMKVKSISWVYTIQIQELKKCHDEGWSSPPSDAYNISSRQKKRGRKKVGETPDGDPIYVDDYDTWYEYDIDRWKNSRTVVTSGTDKNPYWGEYVLADGDSYRNLGQERVGSQNETYTAGGTLIHSDNEQIIILDISKSIWEELKIGDEINYTKRKIGDPYNIEIAM